MKDLIIQSCRFSLGVTLYELFIGTGPNIEAFETGGMLFGTNVEGDSVYQQNIQALNLGLKSYMPDDVETHATIMNFIGLGRDFDLVGNAVVLKS